MKTLFSTAGIAPRDRFDSWHEVARQYVTDHDSRPECRWTFEAQLGAAALDELTLVSFQSAPMMVFHTARHIARSADELFLCRQNAGELLLEQKDRKVVLKPGDMTLLDPRLPYTGRFFEGSSLLVAKIPRLRLQARLGRMGNMVARPMPMADAENRLVSEFLELVTTHTESLGATAGVLADQALDLFAMALVKAADASGALVTSARFLVSTRIRAAIRRRISDPALNPSIVAAAAGVSVRYANAVLGQEHTSVARLILTERLERCRRALADPRLAYRTIADIAYGWGFSDMTHFGRRFKAAYAQLPSEYRRQHRGTTAP
jgi:AraC-like DNA-binding protein